MKKYYLLAVVLFIFSYKLFAEGVSESFLLTQLKEYGYKIKNPSANTPENQEVVKAFKSHFSQNQNPSEYNGVITEQEMIWAWGLVAKYRKK